MEFDITLFKGMSLQEAESWVQEVTNAIMRGDPTFDEFDFSIEEEDTVIEALQYALREYRKALKQPRPVETLATQEERELEKIRNQIILGANQ